MQRRVVVTKNIISFAFIGEEHQIDHVPLSEVEFVKEMKVFDAPIHFWINHSFLVLKGTYGSL